MKTWDVLEMDGYRILVGRSAQANDELTFRVGRPRDLWLHVQGTPGSHVIVQLPEGWEAEGIPAAVSTRAAELAAFYSKSRDAGGKITVHVARVSDVRKERGARPGQVRLVRFRTVRVYPRGPA